MVSQAVKYPLFWTPSPREGAKKQLFSGQAERKGGNDRKQVWKFWSIFSLKFDSLIFKTYFISLRRVSKMSFHALLVVVKMRAGLLQMIIRRDHMMELGILIVGWKLPFSCVKSVSEHIICHYLGSNTQPKTKSPKAVSWGGGLNSYGQPDRKITVFTPSLRFLPANWFLQWLLLVQDDRKFATLNTS